jgi:hypothetical protein
MRKHDRARNSKQTQDLGKLEKRIKQKLESTGLIMHVGIHKGNLNDNYGCLVDETEEDSENLEVELQQASTRNPTYIEYRIDTDSKVVYGDCRRLRDFLLSSLRISIPQIMGIGYSQPYEGVYRARPILNPEFPIEDEKEFNVQILSYLEVALQKYLLKNPPRKIR